MLRHLCPSFPYSSPERLYSNGHSGGGKLIWGSQFKLLSVVIFSVFDWLPLFFHPEVTGITSLINQMTALIWWPMILVQLHRKPQMSEKEKKIIVSAPLKKVSFGYYIMTSRSVWGAHTPVFCPVDYGGPVLHDFFHLAHNGLYTFIWILLFTRIIIGPINFSHNHTK